MKNNTILFLLLSALFMMQINAQEPATPTGMSCSSGTPESFIYTEDFEYESSTEAVSKGGWTGDLKDHAQSNDYPKNGMWGITLDTEKRTGQTGPNAAHHGSKYLMFEGNGANNKAQVISPAIDLTNTSEQLELSFYMNAYGADIGELLVGVSTSQAGPFTNVLTHEGAITTNWVPVGIDLTAYMGQTIYLQFNYTALGGNYADLAIDFLRLETCGYFCVPGNLGITNITSSQAKLEWTPGSTQTQWEYVLQPKGTNSPTGNGTLTSSNSVTVNNLVDGSTFDVYYRSVCNTGFSEWIGPLQFTTELEYNKTIDCNLDPYTLNYCYKALNYNESPQKFTYTSSNSKPIMLFINKGVVGLGLFTGNDDLVVEDGDGNELYRGSGVNGDLAGLFFRSNQKSSTSNVLHFYIDATFLGGCVEDGFTTINATVSCISCNNIPVATYSKEFSTDCSTNPEYFINVDVTSLGDASSLEITDNLGLYSLSTSKTGNVQIGPYAFNTDIQITVADDQSSSCSTKSKTISVTNCPPPNDNCENAIEMEIGAFGNCTNPLDGTLLEATISPNNIPKISCDPNSKGNDVWYKFVATHEMHRIIFGGFRANEFLDHTFYKGDDCNNLTELYCHKNWDDFASQPTMLTPQLIIGDTYYIRVYAQDQGNTDIEFKICVQDPPTGGVESLCNNAEALCLDETGTYETIARTGLINYMQAGCLEWTVAPTWMTFEIQQSGPLDLTISQTGGNSSNDVDIAIFGPYSSLDAVCSTYMYDKPIACTAKNTNIEKLKIPNALTGEKYIILSSNVSRFDHDLTVKQTNFKQEGAAVLLNRIKEPTIITTTPFCDTLGDGVETIDLTMYDHEILDGDSSFNVTYHLSRADAENRINSITHPSVTAGTTQAIFARLDAGVGSYCYTITHFTITVIAQPIANKIKTVVVCDILSDEYETIDLTNYNDEITGGASNVSVNYYLSEDQANIGSSPLYPMLKIAAGTSQEIFVRIENSNLCYSITNFNIDIRKQPWAELRFSEIDKKVCRKGNQPTIISLVNANFDISEVDIDWYHNNSELISKNRLDLSVTYAGEFTAEIKDKLGNCIHSLSVNIEEKNCEVSSGISPNNDGINDSFDLRNFAVNRLEIFNRNGTLVYSKNNYKNEWHGQSNTGSQLPVGVYFYNMTYDGGKSKSDWIYINR